METNELTREGRLKEGQYKADFTQQQIRCFLT